MGDGLLAVEVQAVVLDDDPDNLLAVFAELQEGVRHPSQRVFVGRAVDQHFLELAIVVKDGVQRLVVTVARLHLHDSVERESCNKISLLWTSRYSVRLTHSHDRRIWQ